MPPRFRDVLLLGIVSAVTLGTGLWGGWVLEAHYSPDHGAAVLSAVWVHIQYASGSSMPYGFSQQNSCLQCPISYAGGSRPLVGVWAAWAPLNASDAYFNLTIDSPITFVSESCAGLTQNQPVHSCWVRNLIIPGGDWEGIGVTLIVPDPASIPGGFQIYVNVTADVV